MITDILRSISIIFFHYTQFARKLQYKGNGPESSRVTAYIHWTNFFIDNS